KLVAAGSRSVLELEKAVEDLDVEVSARAKEILGSFTTSVRHQAHLAVIDSSSVAARIDLARYCIAIGDSSLAVREFAEAARLEQTARGQTEESHQAAAHALLSGAEKLLDARKP